LTKKSSCRGGRYGTAGRYAPTRCQADPRSEAGTRHSRMGPARSGGWHYNQHGGSDQPFPCACRPRAVPDSPGGFTGPRTTIGDQATRREKLCKRACKIRMRYSHRAKPKLLQWETSISCTPACLNPKRLRYACGIMFRNTSGTVLRWNNKLSCCLACEVAVGNKWMTATPGTAGNSGSQVPPMFVAKAAYPAHMRRTVEGAKKPSLEFGADSQ
jgi:hypothetical protein